jgi:hypothetical protein
VYAENDMTGVERQAAVFCDAFEDIAAFGQSSGSAASIGGIQQSEVLSEHILLDAITRTKTNISPEQTASERRHAGLWCWADVFGSICWWLFCFVRLLHCNPLQLSDLMLGYLPNDCEPGA